MITRVSNFISSVLGLKSPNSNRAVSTLNESFLESERHLIVDALVEKTLLYSDLAKLVADFVVHGKAFTAADWGRVFPVKTEAFEIDPKFYEWWFSPDAKDPTQLNCDTHFLPILRPESVQKTTELPPPALQHRFASCIDRSEYNLEVLGELIEHPQEGNPSQFAYDSPALRQNKKIKAELPEYLVARKEMFFRGLSIDTQRRRMKELNAKTNAGYEVLPSALDLSTVAAVIHAVTGDRFLGDLTGMENRWSDSRTENTVELKAGTYLVAVGGQTPFVAGIVGGPGPSGGLQIHHSCDFSFDYSNDVTGVVGLRKFSCHRKLNT